MSYAKRKFEKLKRSSFLGGGSRIPHSPSTSSLAQTSFAGDARTTNIILFGETGVGKSSVINLIAQKAIARVSSDVNGCTMDSTPYNILIDNKNFTIFDTIGLEEPELGVNGYLRAIEKAFELITKLEAAGGIHLLLFCMRGGRITATTQSNYRMFYECLCHKKVPIALVFTGLERETEMEDWWRRNEAFIKQYGIKSEGHACITAVHDDTPDEIAKYNESQDKIRTLIRACARESEAFSPDSHSWLAKFAKGMMSLIKKHADPGRKKLLKTLIQRCHLPLDVAEKIVDVIMESGDAEPTDPNPQQLGNSNGDPPNLPNDQANPLPPSSTDSNPGNGVGGNGHNTTMGSGATDELPDDGKPLPQHPTRGGADGEAKGRPNAHGALAKSPPVNEIVDNDHLNQQGNIPFPLSVQQVTQEGRNDKSKSGPHPVLTTIPIQESGAIVDGTEYKNLTREEVPVEPSVPVSGRTEQVEEGEYSDGRRSTTRTRVVEASETGGREKVLNDSSLSDAQANVCPLPSSGGGTEKTSEERVERAASQTVETASEEVSVEPSIPVSGKTGQVGKGEYSGGRRSTTRTRVVEDGETGGRERVLNDSSLSDAQANVRPPPSSSGGTGKMRNEERAKHAANQTAEAASQGMVTTPEKPPKRNNPSPSDSPFPRTQLDTGRATGREGQPGPQVLAMGDTESGAGRKATRYKNSNDPGNIHFQSSSSTQTVRGDDNQLGLYNTDPSHAVMKGAQAGNGKSQLEMISQQSPPANAQGSGTGATYQGYLQHQNPTHGTTQQMPGALWTPTDDVPRGASGLPMHNNRRPW